MKRKNALTIKDIATFAQVSPATVSNVLNDSPNVSAVTRQRVLATIERFNFRPNTLARSLRKNHSLTIGMVASGLRNHFILKMMQGAEDSVSSEGLGILLCNSHGDMAREKEILQMLEAKQVDGIIIMGAEVQKRGAPALLTHALPLVYLYHYTEEAPISCVIPDDLGGGYTATRHLLQVGYTRIGLINGPLRVEAALLRQEGYLHALAEAGLRVDRNLMISGQGWTQSDGYAMANELLKQPAQPDALFCGSDALAQGVMAALCQQGVRVPQDIALVGFDNDTFAQHTIPPLTTVALPLHEMGMLAVRLLLDIIRQGTSEAAVHRMPCPLILRESCGSALMARTTSPSEPESKA
jgi:LacI family transcriptional regulator